MPTRPRYLATLLAALSFAVVPCSSAEPAAPGLSKPGSVLMYIGTYTGKKSQGIYFCRLDPATGSLSAPELAAEMVNPSWVVLHPSGKFLFACGESGPYPGKGAARSYAVGQDGKLTVINTQTTGGSGPCHFAVDSTGKNLLVSNYGSGSVSNLQISDDGKLSEPVSIDQHPILGPKQKPNAHCSDFDAAAHFALSCDAGLDRVYVYRFDATKGVLTPQDPPFVATAANAHPRHLAFSPDGKFVYVINEAAMSVTAYHYDAAQGALQEIQSIPTLPKDYVGKNGSTAELVMHPSGKFLYGSNRGHDSIVAYAVDPTTGLLTLIGHTSTQGRAPRSFGIDPSGHWLIVGNQDSDSIVEFKIDPKSGELSPTGAKLELGAPVCFKFIGGTR